MPRTSTPDRTKKTDNDVFMVRLKRRNPQRGIKLRSYSVFGYRFEESKGWYKVNAVIKRAAERGQPAETVNFVDYLRDVRQNDSEDAPLAFDVCTVAEAAEIDRREREAAQARARARDLLNGDSQHPNDLTTRDIRHREREEPVAPRRQRGAEPRQPQKGGVDFDDLNGGGGLPMGDDEDGDTTAADVAPLPR